MGGGNKAETAVASAWDANAGAWAAVVREGNDLYREHFTWPAFARLLGDVGGLDVLDAGCGEGTTTRLLARAGARAVGIDLSPRMVALARDEEAREPLGVAYACGSFADLAGFADASFDLVSSFMALMDAPRLEPSLAAFRRVLRPGGRLAFAVLHPCFPRRGFSWVRDAAGTPVAAAVPDYFGEDPWDDRFRVRGASADVPSMVVPRFPRTLSGYLNAVVGAGFAIERVDEPRPDEAVCAEHPFLQPWRDVTAFVLLVRARRP